MKKLKSFRQFTEENVKQLTFVFGRFNPATIGHEKLFKKAQGLSKGGDFKIFTGRTQGKINKSDPLKNKDPLAYDEKVDILRKMFPTFGRYIIKDEKQNQRTLMEVAKKAYADGYTRLIMVAGGDRIGEFTTLLNKYHDQEKAEVGGSYYYFPHGLEVKSAGQRDPEAEGVSGMSASKMRKLAVEEKFGDWKDENGKTHPGFKSGLPSGFKDGPKLFNIIRERLGLKPLTNFREHVDVDPLPIRERYINGEVFNIGDIVINKKNDIKYEILERFTNHVTVKSTVDDSEIKLFITDLQEVYEIGTDEYRKHTEDMTPGQPKNEDSRESIPKGKLTLKKVDRGRGDWYQFYVGNKPLLAAGGDNPRNAVANLEMQYNTDGLDLKPFWR